MGASQDFSSATGCQKKMPIKQHVNVFQECTNFIHNLDGKITKMKDFDKVKIFYFEIYFILSSNT